MTTIARSRHNWARRGVPQLHWLVPLGFAAWAWARLGQPDQAAGLGIGELVSVLFWPVLITGLVFGPSAAGYLVPRDWRKAWFASHPRKPWSKRQQRALLRAYRYRCVFCPVRTGLQFDHYCPRSHGGLTNLWNGMVLCAYHNRVKSNYWQYRRGGKVYYVPFKDANNAPLAARILACERRARRNPFRWLYLAWILAV